MKIDFYNLKYQTQINDYDILCKMYNRKGQNFAKDIINDPSKMKFMRKPVENHHIVYLKPSNQSLPIELISYGTSSAMHRSSSVIFKGSLFGNVVKEYIKIEMVLQKLFDVNKIKKVALPFINNECYCIPCINESTHVYSFLIFTNDLDFAFDFWVNAFSFKSLIKDDKYLLLEFPSLVNSWQLRMGILHMPCIQNEIYIDDIGFNCICFITTNIEKEITSLSQYKDVKIGNIFTLDIANNKLNIALARVKNEVFVEFIEILR